MRFTLPQIRRVILSLFFLILAGGIGFWLGQREILIEKGKILPEIKIERTVPLEKQSTVDFSLFWNVWDRLEEGYLGRKDLDRKKMVYGAISGLVSSLGDPYTVFLPPTENKFSKEDLRGDFEGVGVQIDFNKEQRVMVVAPLSGTPAEKAGVKAGDLILRIVDEKQKIDKDTTGISLPEAVNLIRGPKGSEVKLILQREGLKDPFVVSLKRGTIVVKSVEVKFVEDSGKQIALLKLSRFGDRTYQEWQDAVDSIKNQESRIKNFAGVILDLRNNPGGYLQGSVFIGSEFLSASPSQNRFSGIIVQQDKGIDGKETFSVNRKGQLLGEPLVILINGGSASASEIVAGALQELGRAKLVGEKTFGKGTIQEAEDLPGGAGLHITVARWLLPSGTSIDRQGVKPDFEVIRQPTEDEKDGTKDPQLDKAIEILTK